MIYNNLELLQWFVNDLKESLQVVLLNTKFLNQLQIPVIRKLEKRKVNSSFKNNVWVLI